MNEEIWTETGAGGAPQTEGSRKRGRLRREVRLRLGKLRYLLMAVWLFEVVFLLPYVLDYYVTQETWNPIVFFERYCSDTKGYYLFESVVLLLLLLLFYGISQSIGFSSVVVLLSSFILAFASRIKYINRSELLNIEDLKLTEAAGMAVSYLHVEWSVQIAVTAAILIGFTGLAFYLDFLPEREKYFANKRKLILCVLLAVCAASSLIGYINWFYIQENDISKTVAATFSTTGSNRYVLYRFLQKTSVGYGVEGVSDCYEELLALCEENEGGTGEQGNTLSASDYPNVIVIMNESWWNTDYIDSDKISFSEEPMSVYHELEGQCVSGFVSANIYGGGTVSSEAEFLTGLNTKYFTSASGFYSTTEGRDMPSIVDYFSALDYHTTAVHPYYGDFYNRSQVYEMMGFDNVLFEEDMLFTDIYTRYISDESLARQIIYEYENGSKNQREFIWAVSIANHSSVLDYRLDAVEDYDYPIAVELHDASLSEKDYDTLVNYVNGIYFANAAFKLLVEYFENVGEPTVILMYGDHIPNFSQETVEVLGLDSDDSTPEMLQKLYTTPVLMWKNYDLEWTDTETDMAGEITGNGINQLGGILLDYAGLPESNMSRILGYYGSLVKADTRFYTMDTENRILSALSDEQAEVITKFRVIQYDIMLGDMLCGDIWQPVTGE